MRYRALGRTGLEISEIGFGCGPTSVLMVDGPPADRRAAVARALERGITLFDTAPDYGNTRSEKHLAQALRELGATPIVSTKVALEEPDYGDLAGGVVRSIEGSLERLGLDVLPIVHMHNRVGPERMAKSPYGSGALLTLADVLGPNGVVEGFARAKQRGLVRFIGCQCVGGDPVMNEALIDSGNFDSMIINYSMLDHAAFDRLGPRAAQRGMGIFTLRILAKGALATPELVPQAIRFGLSTPGVSTVLVGISEVAHVDAAADAAEGAS
ncbi:MAG TPA: aldo/keto reductase [Candidatus Lustribacter sp.]|nr:aldo/keto reductase [Candidatus Lustribacter sp.]